MQKFNNILIYLKLYTAVIICSLTIYNCRSNTGLINKDQMAQIISQMYLADQYIERNPKLRSQTDSLYLYKSIINKFGYNVDDYQKSLNYYLQKKNIYYKINVEAKNIIKAEENKLAEIVAKENKKFLDWWAIDSLKVLDYKNLIYFPQIRTTKWLLFYNDNYKWKFGDSLITDIPQNIIWWENNYNVLQVDSIANKYNVLTKDYSIRKKNENNKCKLHNTHKGEDPKERLLKNKR